MVDRTASEPRYAAVARARGFYESYYLKASHPTEPHAFWIRYTLLKRPGRDAVGTLWFTRSSDAAVGARAHADPSVDGDAWLNLGEAHIGNGTAVGSLDTAHLSASWDLRFADGAAVHHHLPAAWMYRAPLPKTKPVSLTPATTFTGSITIGTEHIAVDGWPGMVGHNWGAEHAERWMWLHGDHFDDAPDDTWLDVVIGRIKIGPVLTPWIANGSISVGGEVTRVGGIGRVRATNVDATPDGGTISLLSARGPIRIESTAPRARTAVWRYADPSGGEHHVFNCSTADMTVRFAGQTLIRRGGTAFELGVREHNHGRSLIASEIIA